MPNSASTQANRLGLAVIGVLVLVTLIGTMVHPESQPLGWAAVLFYVGLAIYFYVQIRFGVIESLEKLPVAFYYALQLALYLGILSLPIRRDFLYLLAMPIISRAAFELRWPGILAVALGYMTIMAGSYQSWRFRLHPTVSVFVGMAAAFTFVIAFSRMVKLARESQQRAEQLAQEVEKANAQLRLQTIQEAALAAANERNRIARDIHDGLGHYLTVIAVQLEAARALLNENPARAEEAVTKAETLSRAALDEVRRSVGTLRSRGETVQLADSIRELLDQSARGEVLSLHGVPRPVPAALEEALLRTAQEGLTNARKHARASQVEVILDYRVPDRVSVEVADNGQGGTHPAGKGFGLLGLRERISAAGGTFLAGPRVAGGFSVRAEVPA